jgi:hypothetical protein
MEKVIRETGKEVKAGCKGTAVSTKSNLFSSSKCTMLVLLLMALIQCVDINSMKELLLEKDINCYVHQQQNHTACNTEQTTCG